MPPFTPNCIQTHPTRRYTLKPFFKGNTYSEEFRINSLGLRDLERPILGKVYKIAIFGDSITFGIGVKMKKTFTKLLENKLNRNYGNKPPIQVFNFGIPGYNTVQEYRYMAEVYNTFKPDMIILVFTANDALVLADIASGINKYQSLRAFKDVLRNLYSYNFLASRFYSLAYNWKLRKYKESHDGRLDYDMCAYQEDYQGWIEAKKAFADIKRFCDFHNIDLIFAIYTNNFELSPIAEEDLMYPIVKKIVATLKDINVEYIILIDEAFRDYAGKEKFLWATSTDEHFSELANELAAEELFRCINKYNLIIKNNIR